ncbi:MAG: MaoC family dehydratase [Actinobacteria bacterium]|nr:MaoC family dehydratase [Actinomycetota bacterium]
MAKTIMKGAEGIKAHVGQHLGYSDYLTVTQEMVNTFADATGDHQWIHVDVEKAKKGPFGAPIAHGYLTLSLGPSLLPQVYGVEGAVMGVNYGTNKVHRRPLSRSPVLACQRERSPSTARRGDPRDCVTQPPQFRPQSHA